MIDFAPDAAGSPRDRPTDSGPLSPAEARAEDRKLAHLGDEIARLCAHLHAATYRLLELIRAFDAQQGWHREGFTSCARWLSWRTGIAPGAARERVRVARALGSLPHLSRELRAGRLSYSAARALTRIATPKNEEELVRTARHLTAAQLERLVRAWRAADRAEGRERERERHGHPRPELWLWHRPDGSWTIHGRLAPEAGALLRRALEAAGEELYRRDREAGEGETREPENDPSETAPMESPAQRPPAETRRAEALSLIAEAALGQGLGGGASATTHRADRFQVLLRVSAETLAGKNGNGTNNGSRNGGGRKTEAGRTSPPAPPRIEPGGSGVSAETARRIACDAGVVTLTHDREGHVLDVGRKTRSVAPALRRALESRDGECRFPGCGSRYCDAHHLRHWAQGGHTKLDNLILLCRYHHRLVHEEGWRVVRVEGGQPGQPRATRFRFHRPDGRLLPEVPPSPAVPANPVAALEREHGGLGIGPDTPTPLWTGDLWMSNGPYSPCGGRRGTWPVPQPGPERGPTSPRSRPHPSPRKRLTTDPEARGGVHRATGGLASAGAGPPYLRSARTRALNRSTTKASPT